MKRITAVLLAVIMLSITGCASAGKKASDGQQFLGAVIVTGAVAGGAIAGTQMADSNNMSDTQAVLTGAGMAVAAGVAAGFIYDLILEVFNLKESAVEKTPATDEGETPDFMLQKR
ncbi:MAG: hypothetical protein CVV21_03335 [Candidatus Goldiibacteriota bacterium HGW-Goldbacteria-1]|jgi:hypothetical protein|nr:MAG: hypothetical protein CVV21_03335 [Candidatus Goldiibacteriota bacterium HGW-Goldbacteria-1]